MMDTFLTGGVLRNYGSGWQTIEDSSHRSLNIISVNTTDRYIEVRQKSGDFVVSAIVTVDNDMAASGYTVGLSGGGGISRLVIYRDGEMVDPRTITTSTVPLSNIWYLTVQGAVSNGQLEGRAL